MELFAIERHPVGSRIWELRPQKLNAFQDLGDYFLMDMNIYQIIGGFYLAKSFSQAYPSSP